MGNIISAIFDVFFSILPILIFVTILVRNFNKQVPKPQQNQKKLQKNTINELDLESILKEIRQKTASTTQENQNYELENEELTSYETSSKELQTYESNQQELQSYETISYEEKSYEDLYKQPKKNKPTTESISTKKHIKRKQRNTLFGNKNDIKKAFIISEILKPKF